MERYFHPQNSHSELAQRVESELSGRHEAVLQMKIFLETNYPDFEDKHTEEKITILKKIISGLAETNGNTAEPKNNENRFLVEEFAAKLHFLEMAEALNVDQLTR